MTQSLRVRQKRDILISQLHYIISINVVIVYRLNLYSAYSITNIGSTETDMSEEMERMRKTEKPLEHIYDSITESKTNNKL